jgi:hypothetical protein
MDDDRAEIFLRVQKFLPDPKQVMFTLLIQRNIGPDASVGKEIVPDTVGQPQPFIEMKMSLWQCSTELLNRPGQPFRAAPNRKLNSLGFDTVGQKGSVSAIVEPMRASNGIVEEREKQILVVPLEKYRLVWGRKSADQPLDHAIRIRAAINVVSEKDESDRQVSSAFLVPFNQAQQGLKQVEAPVNVPDGVKPKPVRGACLYPIVVPEYQRNFSPEDPLRFVGGVAERDNAWWHSFAAFFSQSSNVASVLLFGSPRVSNLLPSMVSYPLRPFGSASVIN